MQLDFGKIVLIAIAGIALFIISSFILVNLKKEALYEKAILMLQESLKAEVKAELSVSVFQHFPKVSIKLAGVTVSDPDSEMEDFLNAEAITFKIFPWSLLKNSFNLSEIDIENGEINLVRDPKSGWNLGIFNEKGNGSSNESWNIKDAMFYNVKFNYKLERDQAFEISYLIESGKVSGFITSERSKLTTLLKGKFLSIPEEFSAVKNELSKIQLTLTGIDDFKFLRFSDCYVDVLGNRIDLDASISSKDSSYVHAVLEGNKIERLLSFAPDEVLSHIRKFEGRADYKITADSRKFNSLREADWKIGFSIQNGEIVNKSLKQNLRNLNIEGQAAFYASKPDSNFLHIRSFKIKDNNNDLLVGFYMQPLKQSKFQLELDGLAKLEKVQPYVSDSLLTKLDGSIFFDKLGFLASMKDFKNITDSDMQLTGNIKFDNISLTYNQIEYEKINGSLAFDQRSISANKFLIQFLDTDLEFTGKFSNLLEYIINLTQNKGSSGTSLIAEGELRSQQFNLGSLISGYKRPVKAGKTGNNQDKTTSGVALEQVLNFQGNLNTNIDRLVFDKLKLNDVRTKLFLQPSNIKISTLDCSGMNGNIMASGNFMVSDENSITLDLTADVDRLNIKELFRQCNNFGQQTLKDDHLNGDLFANIHFTSKWKNVTEFQKDKLLASSKLRIENGTLNDFEPLSALSKHISLEELQHIKFASLENTVKIEDSNIQFPDMEILSNVMKLQMSGSHRFNNNIDYRFKLNLKSLLAKKFNKKKPRDAISEPLPEGGLNLYIRMSGDIKNPQISFDKEGRREKIREDFMQQKEDLKKLFSEEEEKTSPQDLDKHFEIKKKPEYIIWEDDSTGVESLK